MSQPTALFVTKNENKALEQALANNGIGEYIRVKQLEFLDCFDQIMIAFIDYDLADESVYKSILVAKNNQHIPIFIINGPDDLSIADKAKYYHLGYADILQGTPDIISARLIYFYNELERVKQSLQKEKHSTTYQKHVAGEREIAIRMFDTISKRSCFSSINISSNFSPERLFNGDLLLAGRKPDNDIIVFLGDFTSAGLPVAIGAIPAAQTFFEMIKKGFSFESIIAEINSKLKAILPPEIFCAAALVEINFEKDSCKIWNGGLPNLILTNKAGEIKQVFNANHPPLAILNSDDFKTDSFTLRVDETDKLFFFSGGYLKAKNERGEIFGLERIQNCFYKGINTDMLFFSLQMELRNFATQECFEEATVLELGFDKSERKYIVPETKPEKFEVKKIDWSLSLKLPPDALRNFDPLPVLLYILTEYPALSSHRSQIFAILAELYTNALDHGILGLDSKQKSDINGFAQYYQAKANLLNKLDDGYVKINLDNIPDEQGGRLIIQIEDSGDGFDYQKKVKKYEENDGYSGRGMAMLNDMCECVEYLGNGNTVKAIYRWTF